MPSSAAGLTPGWLVTAGEALTVGDGGHTWWVEGQVRGSTFGLLTSAESHRLLATLSRDNDPGPAAPDTPWAAAVQRADTSVAVTCSTMLVSGLFAAVQRQGTSTRLQVATDPARVLRALTGPAGIDRGFVHGFAMFSAAPRATPFTDVFRIPPGETVLWQPGRATVTTVQWCGPDTLGAPDRDGDDVNQDYLQIFDTVVADLAARSGPLVATVSGGLDSTFMAASLVRNADRGRPVHGFCHSPLPAAHCQPDGKFDPDDYPLAQLMADRYPDLLTITALRNTAHTHPLDAALAQSRRTGLPTSGPSNSVWLGDYTAHARQLGATTAFLSIRGNATYSDSHRYAAGYYLRRGSLGRLLSLASPQARGQQSWPGAVRHRIVRPLRPTPAPNTARWESLGLHLPATTTPPRTPGRDTYLAWASGHLHSLPGSLNPAGTGGLLLVDPFASRAVIEFAASIHPRHWQRGGPSRALARNLAIGRVPDQIRTRTRRGGQARDDWHIISGDFNRLDQALDTLTTVDALTDIINVDTFTQAVHHLRTRPPHQPPAHMHLLDILRILALAEYLHWTRTEFPTTRPAPS